MGSYNLMVQKRKWTSSFAQRELSFILFPGDCKAEIKGTPWLISLGMSSADSTLLSVPNSQSSARTASTCRTSGKTTQSMPIWL